MHTCYFLSTNGVLNLQLRFLNHSNRTKHSLELQYMQLIALGFQETPNVGYIQAKHQNQLLETHLAEINAPDFFGAAQENFGGLQLTELPISHYVWNFSDENSGATLENSSDTI